ncbi:MAG TPA: hypothetical protein VFP06_17690 [Acidimicrobiales bacterium]|nr:hypothetical protein [Acidimicrobiales bacterium]
MSTPPSVWVNPSSTCLPTTRRRVAAPAGAHHHRLDVFLLGPDGRIRVDHQFIDS